ncbi:hypothetical protein V6R21_15890 [Limibacter armeniacum]|uniref:hypothetical protein n=1 Tax=Limibacter armeniacum TaxID=466084 RepID=UPI002FE51C6A
MDEINKTNRVQELKQIELEFDIIIQKDRRNWLRVAKLLETIEQKGLYNVRARSFTEYVKDLAKRSGINVSTLWRARSGARIYMDIKGIPTLDEIREGEVKTTPEQLEMYSKVRTIAPESIVQEVKEKMLDGQGMRHELKELWQIYRPLKGGKTERGRKPKDYYESGMVKDEQQQFEVPYSMQSSSVNKSIKDQTYVQLMRDYRKMQRFHLNSEDITEANIINALRTRRWISLTLDQYEISRYSSFVNFNILGDEARGKVDLIGIVRKNKEDKNKLPLLFGVSDLAYLDKVQSDQLMMEQATFFHYYYVAVPMIEEHIRKALQEVDPNIGIIAVGEKLEEDTKHELKIVRKSPFRQIETSKHLLIMSKLAIRSLAWDD